MLLEGEAEELGKIERRIVVLKGWLSAAKCRRKAIKAAGRMRQQMANKEYKAHWKASLESFWADPAKKAAVSLLRAEAMRSSPRALPRWWGLPERKMYYKLRHRNKVPRAEAIEAVNSRSAPSTSPTDARSPPVQPLSPAGRAPL